MDQSVIDSFVAYARDVGRRASDDQLRRLVRGARWLANVSAATGLSQYDSVEDALQRAMGPALAFFAEEHHRDASIADLGCGNGALGATIALFAPNLHVDLVDRAKRAYTTSEVLVAKLGLSNGRPLQAAIDTLDRLYDAVVFRALAPPGEALPLASSVVREGGRIFACHRRGDAGYDDVSRDLQIVSRHETLVPGLIMTCYRR